MRFSNKLLVFALSLLLSVPAYTQPVGILGPNQTYGNPTGAPAQATAVSPQTARSVLLLNIDELTKPGDANYPILLADRTVAHTALSAPRTDTLPAANTMTPGQQIVVTDIFGVVTSVNTLTIQRAGADTINGGTNIVMNTARGTILFISDGISAWIGQALGNTLSAVTSLGGLTGAVGVANGIEVSGSNIQISAARRTLPTTQIFASGSGTYTRPANVLWIEVFLVGGGGGGSGSSNATNQGAGGNGGASCWNTSGAACTTPVLSAGGGAGGAGGAGGGVSAGGVVTGSTTPNILGVAGGSGGGNSLPGASIATGGGDSCLGGAGGEAAANGNVGAPGATNTGGGGSAATITSFYSTPSGGGGACIKHIFGGPAATYTYAVGAAGAAGAAGTAGQAGGAGGSGYIVVIEYYGS